MLPNQIAEEQLNELRMRVREIRTTKKWVQEYRINAPVGVSQALSAFYTWLDKQERNTIAMGRRISSDNKN